MTTELGYRYILSTTEYLMSTTVRRKFYSTAWMDEMRKFANPWHASRNWKIELQFKLLAYARGEYPHVVFLPPKL